MAWPGPVQAWQARPYPQLLRGPNFRWWRPILALVLLLAGGAGALLLIGGVQALLELAAGVQPDATGAAAEKAESDWLAGPAGFLVGNLTLAALIPLAVLSLWPAYRWRPRWVASVGPGIRWRWLARSGAVALIVFALVIGGLTALSGYQWKPEPRWGWLMVITIFTTPLQAAGEEYLFRGWILLVVGSAVPSARAGALLGGVVSSSLFALAHGEQDPWLFADRWIFGAFACWLVWRTGGLEAGIALHAANNIVALLLAIGQGGLSDALTETGGDPWSVAVDVAMLLAASGIIARQARRAGLVRLFTPPARPAFLVWPASPSRTAGEPA